MTRPRIATSLSRRLGLTAVLVASLPLTGCMRGPTHQEWVNQANNRWHEARSQLMLPMAIQAFETGDLDRADRVVAEAVALDDDNPHFYLLAGRIQLERGKLERAYHLFEKTVEFAPDFADAHYYRGIVLQRWSKYEEALQAYEEAYRLEPDDPHFLLSQCEMMVALDRRQEALDLLKSKMTYFDQNAGIRMAAAHLYAINGDRGQAAEMLREASLLDPDDPKIQEELARMLLESGKFSQAEQTLAALVRDPSLANRYDLRRSLAHARTAQGKFAEAREVFLQLTRDEPGNVSNWIALGETAWQVGDVGATLTAANRVISLAPDDHRGYLLAGMAWQKRNRPDNALRSFDRAAELAPDDAMPLILRGLTLQQAGKSAAAASAYRAALDREPSNARARLLLQAVEVRTN